MLSKQLSLGMSTAKHVDRLLLFEVENWFLAARANHPLVLAWRDLYNTGWEGVRRGSFVIRVRWFLRVPSERDVR